MKIFITYAREDYEYAESLYQNIIDTGLDDVFLDQQKLLAGDYWEQVIENELIKTDILLYLISDDSLNSRYCRREYIKFKEHHEIVIPICLYLDINEYKQDFVSNLSKFQVLPQNTDSAGILPISKWDNKQDAYNQIVDSIKKKIKKEQKKLEDKRSRCQKNDYEVSSKVVQNAQTTKPTSTSTGTIKKGNKIDPTQLYSKVLELYLAAFGLNFSDLTVETRSNHKLYHFYARQQIAFVPFSKAYKDVSLIKKRIESELATFKQANFKTYLVPFDLFEDLLNTKLNDKKIQKQKELIRKSLDIIDKIIRSYSLSGRLHVARLEIINFEEFIQTY